MQKQILVVEDNELNREMLCECLSGEYEVLEAENGQAALDILKLYKDEIALILLDVFMPVMDGYTFLDRIREDAELSLIPVIVMTQSDSEESEVTALVHGATDFVPKPYRPQVLLHRVASLIRLRETAAMINQFKFDRLTGVYSKEFFYQRVNEILEKNPNKKYTIICSDIEKFKLYNDRFGRDEGDRLLQEIAAIFNNAKGDSGFCGRYSADCFIFLQENRQGEADIDAFFERIHKLWPSELEGISIKWGIYEIVDRSISVEKMCDRALLAANSIKGHYNKHIAVYDDSVRSRLLKEKAITDVMENALEENQFIVYFQPKYSLSDQQIVGAEALVRWIHPELGFISPGEFIPLFEKNGFISRLDRYVWENVCKVLKEWREKGYPLIPVSVNVSRSDTYQTNLSGMLLELIQKYGIEPEYLHLEITESAYAENPGQIISTVKELRKIGFIIEMDDFGSGYSSLNMLSQMEMDILKLDMKFIQNEIAKPVKQSILSDVVAMAHKLCLGVVAEGVENREQMKRLQSISCDYVQGYYFAKPMPKADFEELFKKHTMSLENSEIQRRSWKTGKYGILLIDDDEEYRSIVRTAFGGKYHIWEAVDEESARSCILTYGNKGISAVLLSMSLAGDSSASLLSFLRKNPEYLQIPVLALIPCGDKLSELPMVNETDDFLCKCHPLFDLQRRVQRLIDMAFFQQRESVLMDEANRDHLTGLLNRRGLQAAMTSIRKEEYPVAVCLFDLDDLKKVNDTYGHEAGDRMICSFADLLRRQTRAEDIQCRYGGDEFIVVLKHLEDVETVWKKSTDICRVFHESNVSELGNISCSAGIAMSKVDESFSAELIEHADQALYRAKKEKKGGCCIWKEQ